MNSVWRENTIKPVFPSLEGNVKTDVLIIGGGLAGILCAYMLKSKGTSCILAEGKNICSGVTGNTTAKITIQHGLIYDRLITKYGYDKAFLYLQAHSKALKEFSLLCNTVDCDYEKKDSFVYSVNDRMKIEKEIKAIERLGLNAEFSQTYNLPIKTAGAVRIKNQAQFNPLKFAFGISKTLPVYENTKITGLLEKKAITNSGTISFNKLIIATHFPILNKHGAYSLKMYQHRSYVLALDCDENIDGMYVDENEKGLSFRNYKNLLLLGGGSHRTGKSGGSFKEIEKVSSAYYPSAKILNKWATQDCMTLDGISYIGQYSKNTPDIFVATGFNKWGMTSSMVSAMILSDMVQGKKNEYASLFSPSRSILHPQLMINIFESTVGLITPTKPRCPHLGCALKYNKAEHSWDCPCHGSRFEEDGELIDNPATDDLPPKSIKK